MSNKLNAWALVNKKTNQIECLEFTRSDIREQKRSYAEKGIETKISKLTHEKFCR